MTDVIVVGGGVIGLSVAYELAGQGASVTLLERGRVGQEASWAGAGMLPPASTDANESPEARLRGESHRLWPQWTARLFGETSIDNGYRRCGALELRLRGDPGQLDEDVAARRREGITVEELTGDDLATLEPQLNSSIVAAYRLPDFCQLRNPRHLKALVAGCVRHGVTLVEGSQVIGFETQGDRIAAVRTIDATHAADRFVVAGGAWSQPLLNELGLDVSVEPVRGQIVLLETNTLPCRHALQVGKRYVVPRPDGRILIGSTEEWVGFDKSNTAQAVSDLIQFAVDLVPSLSNVRFERSWAGLRPQSADGLPYIGPLPGKTNCFVAAGHFRSGLQLAPITAVLIRELVFGEAASLPLEPFGCDRSMAANS